MIQSLSDEDLRRFINNLISWHQDEPIELTTKSESAIWSLIEPSLLINDKKWNSRAGTSRENGKLGGRPKKEITQETQQVNEEPTKPVNSKMLIVNSEEEIVNGEEEMVGCIMDNQNSNLTSNNTGISQSEFYRNKIENLGNLLVDSFPQYPFLITMANPNGIKELKNHIDNKKDLGEITSILKDLASSKKILWGRYD